MLAVLPAIAIIDDDAQLGRSLGRLLRESGFRPYVFRSGQDFLHSPERPYLECLLIDVQLGELSGIDLRRRLLADGDTTPVIFITAHSEPEVRMQALSLGCAGFFLKSDPGAAIIEVLRRVTLKGSAQS